jgi:hypothetical protein
VTLSSAASVSLSSRPVAERRAAAKHASRSSSEIDSVVRSFFVASHGFCHLKVTNIAASPMTAAAAAAVAWVRIATAALPPAAIPATAAKLTRTSRRPPRPGESLKTANCEIPSRRS